MNQHRQGDVFVARIKKGLIPKDATRKDSQRVILAYGEVTGHHHEVEVMPESVELYEHNGLTYVRLLDDAVLTHQEHGPHTLLPGDYVVEIQREFTDGMIRQVVD